MSNVGTWMQTLTVPYVIFELTRSTTWVGLAGFAALVPTVVVTPLGGALADRFPRRHVLLVAQSLAGILAATLAVTWLAGIRAPLLVLLLGAAVLLCGSFSASGFHALISDLVPPEAVTSAVGLNSMQVSVGKTIGPAIGGVVLATLGPAWTFGANAVSFLGILLVLTVIRPRPIERSGPAVSLLSGILAGAQHVWRDRGMRSAFLLTIAITSLANPLLQIVAPYTGSVLGGGPTLIGALVAMYGGGSVVAVGFVSRVVQPGRRGEAITSLVATLGLGVIVVGLAPGPLTGLAGFFLVGGVYILTISPLIATFHLRAAPDLRARAMSVFLVAFSASLGVGTLLQGAVGDRTGLRVPIVVAGLALTSIGCWARRRASTLQLEARPPSGPVAGEPS